VFSFVGGATVAALAGGYRELRQIRRLAEDQARAHRRATGRE